LLALAKFPFKAGLQKSASARPPSLSNGGFGFGGEVELAGFFTTVALLFAGLLLVGLERSDGVGVGTHNAGAVALLRRSAIVRRPLSP
jgi:hypothetical protein